MLEGDTLITPPTLTTDADMSKADKYAITASGADAGGNYSITYVPGTLTVNNYPAYRITVKADGKGSAETDYKSARSGRRVTITAAPDDGFVLKYLTVTTATGREIAVTDRGDGTYTFTMPGAAVTVTAKFGIPFADIEEDHQFYEAIEWAYTEGLMIGKTETAFDRVGDITRQQIWMVLARINGVWPENMADAKAWAVERGITDGSRPGDAATREEMVTMMWKGFGQPEAEESVLDAFPDKASVSTEAVPAMAWAVEQGIVIGTSAGDLEPDANITRGAFAAILNRYLAK